jgi:thiol-disulfide isomerase/thioredoxin
MIGDRLVRLLACAASAVATLFILAGAPVAGAAGEKTPAAGGISDWSLRTIEGKEVRFSEALTRGPVLLSFWATWCGPCLTEMPHLDALARETKGRLTVYAISIDSPKSVAKVRPYMKSKGFDLIVPLDTAGEVNRLLQVGTAVPYLVLYDRSGKEVYHHVGYRAGDERELRSRVDALLAARPDSVAVPEGGR